MKKFIALEIGDKNLNHKVKDIVTVYIPSEEKKLLGDSIHKWRKYNNNLSYLY